MSGDGKQRSNDPESQSDSSRYIDRVHTPAFVAKQTRKKVDAIANQTAHQIHGIHRRSSIVDRRSSIVDRRSSIVRSGRIRTPHCVPGKHTKIDAPRAGSLKQMRHRLPTDVR